MLNFDEIEKIIHYSFKDRSLLETALTHTSYANETGENSYERLEFLGDSILGFITAQNLFITFPDHNEGELTKIRAALVCEQSLAKLFTGLKLNKYIRLGAGEEKNDGREKESILSDCFEALLAAVYVDSDFDTSKAWLNIIMPPEKYDDIAQYDWKSLLYERHANDNIEYKITDFGHTVAERFKVEVFINEKFKSVGFGTTKKSAVQAASKKALK